MTWAEFKKVVEAAGVKDGDVVDYIDTDKGGPLEIARDDSGSFVVYGDLDWPSKDPTKHFPPSR